MKRRTADLAASLERMLEAQRKYDSASLEALQMNYRDILEQNGYFRAILDEIGEFNHACKKEWCWFRKLPDPGRDHILEEYVDILHFVLSFLLALGCEIPQDPEWNDLSLEESVLNLLQAADMKNSLEPSQRARQALDAVLAVGARRAWSIQEIESRFLEKDRKNYERMETKPVRQ